jgi:hypothetical protein
LDVEKLAAAEAEFLQLEKEDIDRRSISPWASPFHMVRKQDGPWQPCIDYRHLNRVTKSDVHLLPNMMDFTTRAGRFTVYRKIDFRKGFLKIPMHPADLQKMAITTPAASSSFCIFLLGCGTWKIVSNRRSTMLLATWTMLLIT